ncbi:MAG: 2Fe-2S iron-sulfur cluster-binding protein, partial [Nocardioidaceae bacterium]
MSTTTNASASGGSVPEVRQPEPISVTIDGFELTVPKGTLVIRAAEMLGIEIPRFC